MPLALPKVRDDLIYAPSSEDEGYFFVKCPVRNDFFRYNELQISLMKSLDGTRNTEDIIEVLGEEWGVEMEPEQVDRFVNRLSDRFLLDISSYDADDENTRKEIQKRLKKRGLLFRIEARDTDSPEAQLFAQGMHQVMSENPLQAASYFRAILDINPDNYRAKVIYNCIHEAFLHVRRSDMPYGALAIPLFDPSPFLAKVDKYFGRFIYSRLGLLAIVAVILLQIPIAVDLATSPHFAPGSMGVADVLTFIIFAFPILAIHELGHGLSCKHYGGTPNEIGLMLILGIIPAAYCDTSDSYMFTSSRHKIVTFMSGMPAQLVFMTFMFSFLWVIDPDTPGWTGMVLVTLLSLTDIYINLNPLLPFDGYFALGDYLGIINLRARAFEYLWAVLGKVLLGVETELEADTSPRERRILFGFGALAVVYTVVYIFLFMMNFLLPWAAEHLGAIGLVLVCWYFWARLRELLTQLLIPLGRFIYRERTQVFTLTRTLAFATVFGGVIWLLSLDGHVHVSGAMVIEPAELASVSAGEAGLVQEIRVHEGDYVAAGDVLVVLRADELQQDLTRTKRNVARAQTLHAMLKAGARKEEIELSLARYRTNRVRSSVMRKRLNRASSMHRLDVGSQADVLEARGAAVQASNKGRTSQYDVELVQAGTRTEEIAEASAHLERLQTRLEELLERVDRLTIRSPIAGQVITKDLGQLRGKLLAAGTPLFQVQDDRFWRVRIRPGLGEPIEGIRPGQRVRLRAYGYPDEELELTVLNILPPPPDGETTSVIFETTSFTGSHWRTGMTGHARIYGPKRSFAYRYVSLPLVRAFNTKIFRLIIDV